jgi:hypothetical protein
MISISPAGISEGNAGANGTWNFSGISATGTSYTYNVISPSSTPFSGSFPGATIIVSNTSFETYSFYHIDNTSYDYLGSASVNSGVTTITPFTKSETFLVFPVSYNSSFSDNFSYSFQTSGYTFSTAGTISGVADAYGTLLLPQGTFNNVLRVKTIQDYSNTNDIPGSQPGNSQILTYSWYDAGTRYPLLTITYTTSGTNTTKSVYYYDYLTSANKYKDPKTFEIISYSNPAKDIITVDFCIPGTSDVFFSLFDLTGKNIITQTRPNLAKGRYIHKIDTENLLPGIYIIQAKTENNVITKKVVLQ